MLKIPKQEYTTEFRTLAVKRVKDGWTATISKSGRDVLVDAIQTGKTYAT
jgi:hypothetical protein